MLALLSTCVELSPHGPKSGAITPKITCRAPQHSEVEEGAIVFHGSLSLFTFSLSHSLLQSRTPSNSPNFPPPLTGQEDTLYVSLKQSLAGG